ncbi:MAG: hypothetical protein SPG28_01050 [Alloprevotella sp.]|nr:hypothetical protein [Alloprevotella sp.]
MQASAIELAHIAERSRKYVKVKHFFFAFAIKSKRPLFSVFLLAAFEAGGNRPQSQGLRASKSRKALMLGVKTGGVPLGFKRSKRFLWFLSKSK